MKIVFTSFCKTLSKENTKNYTPNSYIFVFLINVIFFLIIWDGGCSLESKGNKQSKMQKIRNDICTIILGQLFLLY